MVGVGDSCTVPVRTLPVERVLEWRDPQSWWPCVRGTLAKERRRAQIKAVPREQALDALAWCLSRDFTHVRLYHGCRPKSAASYYRQGICRHDGAVLERARTFFRSQQIPAMAVAAAIEETDLSLDNGRVFLALDGEHLVKYAGHYLLYGSESLMAIAATLMRMGFPNAQCALSHVGRPTLFTCELPMSGLPFRILRELGATLYHQFRSSRGRMPKRIGAVDHTVVVHEDVAPNFVRTHVEPREIVDWHHGGVLYSESRHGS